MDLDPKRKKIKMIVQSALISGCDISTALEKEFGGCWKVTSNKATCYKAKPHKYYMVKIPKTDDREARFLYVYPTSKCDPDSMPEKDSESGDSKKPVDSVKIIPIPEVVPTPVPTPMPTRPTPVPTPMPTRPIIQKTKPT